jgi:hypothetical protein
MGAILVLSSQISGIRRISPMFIIPHFPYSDSVPQWWHTILKQTIDAPPVVVGPPRTVTSCKPLPIILHHVATQWMLTYLSIY